MYILLSIAFCYGQANPFYKVIQENVRPIANSNFEVTGMIQAGNPFYLIYPAYTTFLTDGYVLENIPSSKHIQGIPIGFKFPYAGQEFDIFALNSKGYIVLGKSSEGGMTVYADTLIETATDTVFTNKNKYLISGLYPGKNLDLQGQVYIYIYKGGFEGERRLYISLISIASLGGNQMFISTNFELRQTGEININPYVQYITNNTNNPIIDTYASIMQRYGTDQTHYIYGTGFNSNAWFQTAQSYTNGNYKYGILGDTIMPASVNQKLYTINYLPKISNFMCPVPIRWNPNLGNYKDSAYAANDYEELQGDTLLTSDRVWWFSDMRDSLRFDVYLGADEISMDLYKKGLYADSIVTNFNTVLGLVNLPLDSLAGGQKYFLRIHTIHPSGDTTVCNDYSFYTKQQEKIVNYCRSEETMGGLDAGFFYSVLDLNTLHFHPDTITDLLLEYKNVLPDTGSWTTTLQQGQSYQLQLGTIETSYYIQAINLPLVSIFIDYNNDGYFNEDNELYHTTVASTYRYNDVTITVPSNAVCGKTRLRIVQSDRSPYPSACSKPALGASLIFKDFIITIAQAPGCNLSYSDTIISPSCATYSNGGLEVLPQGGTAPYHIQWNTGNTKDTLFTLSGLSSPARQRANISDAAGCYIRTDMLQLTQPAPLRID
ncbi:SprB repeat-containing protein, partial [uncultured Cytophaga sp.]|uniref:SprB repeat-containing protein n=1 Tax=uncultured Cytophaga sp. TaxID=160238 RepID=UPI002629D512